MRIIGWGIMYLSLFKLASPQPDTHAVGIIVLIIGFCTLLKGHHRARGVG